MYLVPLRGSILPCKIISLCISFVPVLSSVYSVMIPQGRICYFSLMRFRSQSPHQSNDTHSVIILFLYKAVHDSSLHGFTFAAVNCALNHIRSHFFGCCGTKSILISTCFLITKKRFFKYALVCCKSYPLFFHKKGTFGHLVLIRSNETHIFSCVSDCVFNLSITFIYFSQKWN